jgi:hypothetical protein
MLSAFLQCSKYTIQKEACHLLRIIIIKLVPQFRSTIAAALTVSSDLKDSNKQ